MSKNMVELERPQTIWRLRPCTHTLTEICNTYCLPRQKWFRERLSILRYTCIAYLVNWQQKRLKRPQVALARVRSSILFTVTTLESLCDISLNFDVLWVSQKLVDTLQSTVKVWQDGVFTWRPAYVVASITRVRMPGVVTRWIFIDWKMIQTKLVECCIHLKRNALSRKSFGSGDRWTKVTSMPFYVTLKTSELFWM